MCAIGVCNKQRSDVIVYDISVRTVFVFMNSQIRNLEYERCERILCLCHFVWL